MEQMTSICDMVGQYLQKKEEDRRITEDQAAKDRYWKIPICYNDDDNDYSFATQEYLKKFSSAITPDLPKSDSLIMEDEHLNTIPKTESDELLKSSVEDLVHTPSESDGISEGECDLPIYDDFSPKKDEVLDDIISIPPGNGIDHFNAESSLIESMLNPKEDIRFIKNLMYDNSFPRPPETLKEDSETIVSLEEVNEDQEEKEFDLEDIFQIQDVILREKLLNISRLVTNIESLKDNPTPDGVFNSPSSFPIPIVDSDSFFEKSDTSLSHLDNSLPKFETFSDHTEETRSGSTTTNANNSLLEYDLFLFEVEPDQGGLISIVIFDNSNDPLLELPEFKSFHFDLYDDPSFPRLPLEPPDVEISLIVETDAPVINNFDELNKDECFDPGGDEIDVEDDDSFTFVIRTFLLFLTYLVDSPFLYSFGSEDTIFDLGISI
ncbi:hypothetical protein Tco_1328242 [Tanacetum coccineum]